jgi:hypothetical protein
MIPFGTLRMPKPSDVPVEQATRFELVINSKGTAFARSKLGVAYHQKVNVSKLVHLIACIRAK